MQLGQMTVMILVMAGVTYLIRMIPFVFFRNKIKSAYLKSVLFYVPYAVLSAMTFPYVFYSTGNFYTALIGTVVAVVAAVCKRSLLTVAIIACVAVLIAGIFII